MVSTWVRDIENDATKLQIEWDYSRSFEGYLPRMKRNYQQTNSDYIRKMLEKFMVHTPCSVCKGLPLIFKSIVS